MGAQVFWDHHQQNFNSSYDEDSEPFSASSIKKNKPIINVKKNDFGDF